jgi:hypothetical protein
LASASTAHLPIHHSKSANLKNGNVSPNGHLSKPVPVIVIGDDRVKRHRSSATPEAFAGADVLAKICKLQAGLPKLAESLALMSEKDGAPLYCISRRVFVVNFIELSEKVKNFN